VSRYWGSDGSLPRDRIVTRAEQPMRAACARARPVAAGRRRLPPVRL